MSIIANSESDIFYLLNKLSKCSALCKERFQIIPNYIIIKNTLSLVAKGILLFEIVSVDFLDADKVKLKEISKR